MSHSSPKMVVVSPHPDDCILGAAGTMARFVSAGGKVTVLTIAAHSPPLFPEEVHIRTVAEADQALQLIGINELIFLDRPALSLAQMPHQELNKCISDVLIQVQPNVLIIPYCDRNIDHKAVFESAMVASRPCDSGGSIYVVAACEILSSTHYNAPHLEPNFTPNWTVDISDFITIKLEALRCCESQAGRETHPRSLSAIKGLARFRGSQAGMVYGEAFHTIRMTAPPEILF